MICEEIWPTDARVKKPSMTEEVEHSLSRPLIPQNVGQGPRSQSTRLNPNRLIVGVLLTNYELQIK